MFCLVYASAGVSNWSPEEVQDMLIGFREKNASLDVTGMLLYKDGSFLQALEGDEAVVRDLYATSKLRSSLNSPLRFGASQIGRWVWPSLIPKTKGKQVV